MNIRTMAPADIPFAMRLKAQNDWNQLEADWQRQLALEPAGSFVAELDGQPVGTACACLFGDVAWVNYVLVDQAQRGQGVGTALMRHVIAWLDARKVPTIRLDATPLGQPVYEKLGFVGDFTLSRHEGTLPSPQRGRGAGGEGAAPQSVTVLLPSDLPAIFALDEAVTRTPRAKLLRHLYDANPTTAFKYAPVARLTGYCLCRPGSNACHIGPIQGDAKAGRRLLPHIAERLAGERVYLDIPTNHGEANAIARALGLTVQRSFLRMTRGRRIVEDLHAFWAGSGPEKG